MAGLLPWIAAGDAMSWHKADWEAFGASVVLWFKAHPNVLWDLAKITAGFILGAIFF